MTGDFPMNYSTGYMAPMNNIGWTQTYCPQPYYPSYWWPAYPTVPQPCPSCGHCPTCGVSKAPSTPYAPPYTWTVTTAGSTADTTTTGNPTAKAMTIEEMARLLNSQSAAVNTCPSTPDDGECEHD